MEKEQELNGEKYVNGLFTAFKKMEKLSFEMKNGFFNRSEMRLLGEVVMVEEKGEKVISIELAERLGLTRSAISQTVGKLEKKGIIRREADEKDKKIAYIKLTEKAKVLYEKEKKELALYVEKLIALFGKEKMEELLRLSNEFVSTVTNLRES